MLDYDLCMLSVLPNGTTFYLQRTRSRGEAGYVWVISRGGAPLYVSRSSSLSPPSSGWTDGRGQLRDELRVRRTKTKTKAKEKWKIRNRDLRVIAEEVSGAAHRSDLLADRGNLKFLEDKMLHKAIGPKLGRLLHERYVSALPVDSITLDGVFAKSALQKALTFMRVPLSEWEGPETSPYCCKGKYRLNFGRWDDNKYSRGLQALLYSPKFVGFLEELTGIFGLIPMRIHDDRVLWAGSSLIAVEPGGYLDIHNDVRN